MTDELPPHLVALQKLKRGRKPPPPTIETVQTGSVSMARDPDPLLPVGSDNLTRWVTLAQAAALIAAKVPDRSEAQGLIMSAALDGLVPLSCEVLVVQSLVGQDLFTINRPNVDAKLAARIRKARKSTTPGYARDRSGRYVTWVELLSGNRATAHNLLIDAESVAAFYADPVLNSAPVTGPATAVPVASPTRGILPRPARNADLKNEEYAHQAACLVRTGDKLAQAIRAVAPRDGTREQTSVESGIRRTFNLMYDLHGRPLAIQK